MVLGCNIFYRLGCFYPLEIFSNRIETTQRMKSKADGFRLQYFFNLLGCFYLLEIFFTPKRMIGETDENKARRKNMELIYEDLTHELIGCFFQVHNTVGVGYDEFTYHKALERRFRKIGFDHCSEERKALMHRGRKAREFKADLITFDKIILELKTLQSNFVRANYVQIISELKLWEMRLGLLVNFGLQKVEIERIPFTEKTKTVCENYDYVRD